jgi:hypothetical protein
MVEKERERERGRRRDEKEELVVSRRSSKVVLSVEKRKQDDQDCK